MSDLISTLKLNPGRDYTVRRGHPWIFSGALPKNAKLPAEGSLVRVVSNENDPLGIGLYSGKGSIAVKILSQDDRAIDAAFWRDAIGAAVSRRRDLGLLDSKDTTAFRIVNAEGDSLPGLIVDLYGGTAVVQCQIPALKRYLEQIANALREALGARLIGVYHKSHEESDEAAPGYILGGPGSSEVLEHGMKFLVDWERGQKTGFFLDQRENRRLVREMSAGKRVLNVFCYTGGFSVAALAGRANSVVSVDSSKPALEILEKNIAINFENARHESRAEDFFKTMGGLSREFDLIVLDPPAFAKDRRSVKNGLKGYRSINEAAFRALPPGGLLFTFSCSQLVSRDDFRNAVADGAAGAKRTARIIAQLSQAPCHPVCLAHPEGEYLKGLVLAVD